MAVALAFPETQQGKRAASLLNNEVSSGYVRQARYVLRNNPPALNGPHARGCWLGLFGLKPLNAQIDGGSDSGPCQLGGIPAHYRVLESDPTAYVLSANVHRRHLTKGQQAMAVALAFPETQQGKKRTSLKIKEVGLNAGYVSQARFVLRHCLDKAEEVLRNPHYPLTKAYEEVQAMVEQQRKDEEERQERLRQLAALRVASIPQRRARIEGLLSCGCWLGVPPKVRNPHSYPP